MFHAAHCPLLTAYCPLLTAYCSPLTAYRLLLTAHCSLLTVLHMYILFPITTHFTAWYAAGFIIDVIVMFALTFYAFHTSLAGQPVFGGKLLQED